MARTEPWRVSDEFWEKVEPLIPPTPSHAKGGRTRMDDRQAFAAMIYVLRTGIQWNALPRQMGASSTVHDRYQEWERLEFFEQLWQAGLLAYDELEGIEWEWQAIDGAMTKAPLGRGATGKNPTDRAKMGTKRSMLTDGAGIPLAVALEGAKAATTRGCWWQPWTGWCPLNRWVIATASLTMMARLLHRLMQSSGARLRYTVIQSRSPA
jgi:putative transposase